MLAGIKQISDNCWAYFVGDDYSERTYPTLERARKQLYLQLVVGENYDTLRRLLCSEAIRTVQEQMAYIAEPEACCQAAGVPPPTETDHADPAVTLLVNCLPHLDLQISEHKDGYRLRRDILLFLAGCGYPGFAEVRNEL